MRFGDGAWRLLPDVTPTYLSRVDGFEVGKNELVLHVASVLDEARWATLSGHMFTVRLSAPVEGSMRVQVTHHKGRRSKRPSFDVATTPGPLTIDEDESGFRLTTGRLRVEVAKKPFEVKYFDTVTGELLTSSPFKALAMMHKEKEGLFLRDQLTLSVGELVYGLGERFSAFAKNGQTVDMWNADCGTCSDKGYKDVPFFLTSRGWGLFVNTPARASFEVGTEQVMRAQFAVPGHDLDYYFVSGPTPKEVLARLGAISGRPALPPVWSFGLWLTTSFTTEYDEATVTSFIDGMAQRDIPLHVFHFDCFWMKGHHWCDFRWDEKVFPDPEGMLRRLKSKGLRICVWINPYIGERSYLFDEGTKHGYLLNHESGDVYQRPKWQAGMGYVDFSNPDAVRWYQDKLRALLHMGVDCFKTDFGEEIPTDVRYHDGSDPAWMHQYYTYQYNRAVFELLEQERGKGEALVFARSATATCQKFPVHWGGDCYGNFESMAESLRGGLSLTLSGFGYWSHDIGGFESKASAAVYKRWVAFGLLSSHSRLHGSTSYRVPWLYDDEACVVLKRFTELKCRLMPYLMTAAVQAQETNLPMMRAMVLEYPDDPTCRTLDRQYLLGDALLVAPVFHESRAEYYLPRGDWTHLLTGEVRSGGSWFFDEQDFHSVPVWVRPNGIVAVGTSTAQVDYALQTLPRLVLGRLDGKSELWLTLYDRAGQKPSTVHIVQDGPRVTVRSSLPGFELQLPWANAVNDVLGGAVLERNAAERSRAPITERGVIVEASGEELRFVWAS
jgi:alpha-D-xyloside xylohydrolase